MALRLARFIVPKTFPSCYKEAVLHVFRRHYRSCPHKPRRNRRCNCPLWVQGSLGGEWIKGSLNLVVTDSRVRAGGAR